MSALRSSEGRSASADRAQLRGAMRLPRAAPLGPPRWPGHGMPAAHGPCRQPIVIGRPASELWWLNPLACVAIIGVVYAVFMAFDFSRVVPHAYIPGLHYAWGGALLVALALGIAAAMAVRREAAVAARARLRRAQWLMAGLFGCTAFAYAVWFQPLLENPGLIARDLRRRTQQHPRRRHHDAGHHDDDAVRCGLRHCVCRDARQPCPADRAMGASGIDRVFVLGCIRAVAWSERLAVIELVVAYVVAAPGLHARDARADLVARRRDAVDRAGGGVRGFTVTEYFRSWHYFVNDYDSVWEFAFERLIAYYATASNNGIGLSGGKPPLAGVHRALRRRMAVPDAGGRRSADRIDGRPADAVLLLP